jgi:hypothetical protein
VSTGSCARDSAGRALGAPLGDELGLPGGVHWAAAWSGTGAELGGALGHSSASWGGLLDLSRPYARRSAWDLGLALGASTQGH